MNSEKSDSFSWISHCLSHPAPVLRDVPGHRKAAVAMILSVQESAWKMLFIERATHPGDPWSGNIGFPGGKVEKDDADSRHAAERETMEELGVDLGVAQYLGQISDLDGAHLPVLLSCFVYGVNGVDLNFIISEEVKDVFWLTFAELTDPLRHGMHQFTFAGDRFESPCIRLPYEDKPVLWGLTYRMVKDFLDKTGKFFNGEAC